MADRQWFAEGVQVFETGTEEWFAEGVQLVEDQAAAAAAAVPHIIGSGVARSGAGAIIGG